MSFSQTERIIPFTIGLVDHQYLAIASSGLAPRRMHSETVNSGAFTLVTSQLHIHLGESPDLHRISWKTVEFAKHSATSCPLHSGM